LFNLFEESAMDTMEITVEVKNVYGQEKIYPVCDKAVLLTRLIGTKTIPHYALCLIKELGYVPTVKAKKL